MHANIYSTRHSLMPSGCLSLCFLVYLIFKKSRIVGVELGCYFCLVVELGLESMRQDAQAVFAC